MKQNPPERILSCGTGHNSQIGVDLPGKPLVSIITIVLNDEAGIVKTIESVVQQRYEPIEYIVIDGGSSDNTIAKIREYEKNISHWLSEPDRGISDAFNKGIRAAHGKYIGLLNAGDWYEPHTVQQVVETFQSFPDTGVVCGSLQFWHDRQKEYVCQSEPKFLNKDMTVTHPTCFIRADLYDQYGLYDGEYKYAMDYKLLLGLKNQGVPFVTLESVLANMRHSGISEMYWKQALLETHRARTELLPGSFFSTKWYYYFVELKRRTRFLMQKLGLDKPIALYRSRLALVRKNKA